MTWRQKIVEDEREVTQLTRRIDQLRMGENRNRDGNEQPGL